MRVIMGDKERKDLHDNTAKVLKLVNGPVIQENYLVQIYNIETGYARAVYDELLMKEVPFGIVESKAKNAPLASKDKKFMPFTECAAYAGRRHTARSYIRRRE